MDRQDIDLSQYKWQGDWEWFWKAEAADGERVKAQIDYLSNKVGDMKIGDKLSIIDICSNPIYYDICVKILCVLITGWQYKDKDIRDYVFNKTFTEVRRVC